MIYLFLANGFEEVEALAPLDILRRAGAHVVTVGIGGVSITGAHGITVTADVSDAEAELCDIEAVILPGGMPGASNLDASPIVDRALGLAQVSDAYICAICAAPMVPGRRGYLEGYRAVCFPGFERELRGALPDTSRVCVDRKRITAVGMGAAVEFGLEITACLFGRDTAERLRESFFAL